MRRHVLLGTNAHQTSLQQASSTSLLETIPQGDDMLEDRINTWLQRKLGNEKARFGPVPLLAVRLIDHTIEHPKEILLALGLIAGTIIWCIYVVRQ